MSTIIYPEKQIERINKLLMELEVYKALDEIELKVRPNSKSWSIIEVVKHMSIAHSAYVEKISGGLKKAETSNNDMGTFKASPVAGYLIKRFPPIEGKVKMKMKTMKKFQPLLDLDQVQVDSVFVEFQSSLQQLKSWVNQCRTKGVSRKRFSSAIGPVVRFNVPEACEFILCHNERHFQQMKDIRSNSRS